MMTQIDRFLSDFSQLTNLKELHMDIEFDENPLMKYYPQMFSNFKKIEDLRMGISSRSIDNSGFRYLCMSLPLMPLIRVLSINLECNKISSLGDLPSVLGSLENLEDLSLNFDNNFLEDKDVLKLCQTLKSKFRLEKCFLSLSDNYLSE